MSEMLLPLTARSSTASRNGVGKESRMVECGTARRADRADSARHQQFQRETAMEQQILLVYWKVPRTWGRDGTIFVSSD